MATIGAWWVASHEPLPDETVRWEGKAIRVRPSGSRVGGKLYVTDRRVLFSPHLLEVLFGADAVALDLDTVDAVDRDRGGQKRTSRVHLKRFADDHDHETFAAADAGALVDCLTGLTAVEAQ